MRPLSAPPKRSPVGHGSKKMPGALTFPPLRSGPLRRWQHVRLGVTAARRLWRSTIWRQCIRARVSRRLHLHCLLCERRWGG